MQNATHRIRDELRGILVFIGIIWVVFLLSLAVPSLQDFGVVPRTLLGLMGIASMPFLHASFGHLLSNTVPLFVLLALLAGSKARSWETVAFLVLLGGSLLWLFGIRGNHIGASGLVFGLVTFLLSSGFLEKRLVPLLVSLAVGFLYGGTLIWGILPQFGSHVSWDGHLCGAVAGGVVSYVLTRKRAIPGN
jgi:membrane associated rhomboid family serine protease